MKKVTVKCREIDDLLVIGQLYGTVNEENDIHVNGSVTITGNEYNGYGSVKMYVNLCNEDGVILYVISIYTNFKLMQNGYYSFSAYCADITRFVDMKELAYAEVYPIYDESE